MSATRIISHFLVIFLLGACSVCRGDVVYLTSGGQITGSVIEENDEYIKLELDSGGVTRLQKKYVKKIDYTAVSDAEEAIAKAEKLQKEADAALVREDWGTAVAKYGEAIRQCSLVRESTGELYTRASALSLEFKKQLITPRKELIEEADKELALENYEKAVSYYKATIIRGDEDHTREIGKKIVSIYLPFADACFDKKDYAKSIKYYRECLTLAPEDREIAEKLARAYLERGTAFYQKGRHNEATRDLRTCVKLLPSNRRAKDYLSLIRADTLFMQAGKDKEREKYSVALKKYTEAGKIYKGLLGKQEALDKSFQERISMVEQNVGTCEELVSKNVRLPAVWSHNYEETTKSAKKYDRPILMNFTGSDWCGWCKKLKGEVFSRPSFMDYASKNLLLLEVDFPSRKQQSSKVREQNQRLKRKYGIRGYPTIILIDANGNEIARTGYRKGGPNKYVQHLKSLLSR